MLLVGWLLFLVLSSAHAKGSDERTRFKLAHIIPAKDALHAVRENSASLKAGLLAKVFLSSAEAEANFISIQSKKDFVFTWGGDYRIEEAEGQDRFFQRLPALLPQPQDHETVLNFAKMSANSYVVRVLDGSGDGWRNGTDYEADDGFGWEDTGLRGHVFLNERKTIAVIAFKGTSTILHGGETVARDKYMDNIMFSCCCARVDLSWTPVCGCYAGALAGGKSACNKQCLRETTRSDPDSYYNEGLAVTQLVMAEYPRAQIWFTGHSLGGAIAALMAVRVRKTAAITFSSPGPLLYAHHLGLHAGELVGSQWQFPIWNFGLASDPIYTGTCTGLATSCYLSGYAMETACRHGMDCVYAVRSWQPDVATHRIDWMIDHVLDKPLKYPLPSCIPNRNCTDCLKWTFKEEL